MEGGVVMEGEVMEHMAMEHLGSEELMLKFGTVWNYLVGCRKSLKL